MNLKIHLRPPDLTDRDFIFNSWLKSYRMSDFGRPQCNQVYYDNYKLVVQALLMKSKIVVACAPEDYTQIYGYLIFESLPADILLVHFAYTKFPYRKLGIAKRMLSSIKTNDKPILISHFTKSIKDVSERYNFVYDPYQALIQDKEELK